MQNKYVSRQTSLPNIAIYKAISKSASSKQPYKPELSTSGMNGVGFTPPIMKGHGQTTGNIKM